MVQLQLDATAPLMQRTHCMGGSMQLAGPQVNSYIYEITPAGELVREYGAACTGETERGVQRRPPARAR